MPLTKQRTSCARALLLAAAAARPASAILGGVPVTDDRLRQATYSLAFSTKETAPYAPPYKPSCSGSFVDITGQGLGMTNSENKTVLHFATAGHCFDGNDITDPEV